MFSRAKMSFESVSKGAALLGFEFFPLSPVVTVQPCPSQVRHARRAMFVGLAIFSCAGVILASSSAQARAEWSLGMWIVLALCIPVPSAWFLLVRRRLRNHVLSCDGRACLKCGYDLRMSAGMQACPECGEKFDIQSLPSRWAESALIK
jgi:predicted RNA-binding Zn-ribbon protein involved in translation (DUF1610 family)